MNKVRQKVLSDMGEKINNDRLELSKTLEGISNVHKMAAIVGPCALQAGPEHIKEGKRLIKLSPTIMGIQRAPTWKPRSNDLDWHGLDESDPDIAMHMTSWAVRCGIPRAIEIKDADHLIVYAPFLTFAWLGARSIHGCIDDEVLALTDPSLPIGIKNGLDGDIQAAINRAKRIAKIREQGTEHPGAVTVIYRGGENALNSKAWRDTLLVLQSELDGKFIIDTAHGSSMAHDGFNQKSTLGQESALGHLFYLMHRREITPTGVMVEASDVAITNPRFVTDPNMRLSTALSYIKDFARANKRDISKC